jgi:cysteine synthase/rhodanese-related sulfurtransferase
MEKRTNEQKVLNTFEGSNAVLDFLNPDNAPYTPLVEIPDHLNPYRKDGIRIFAKLMNALPLANLKSLPAYNMLLNRKEKDSTQDTLIENSSGNTVFSLAVIARLMGIPHTKAVVSHEVSRGKLNILRFLGIEVIVNEEPICPDPTDPKSGIYKAKVWAKENNWFNPGQYDNKANPEAHYKWTGPQIWEQTKGKISLLSVGLGTTGSVVGIGKFLKEKNSKIKIIGVSRIANNPVPGVRTSNLLSEIAFDWKSVLDHQEEVGTVESFKMSMELCRAGLFVGPSSGFALVGLLNHLSKQKMSREEKIAVFICPDSPFPYIDEYFQYLEPSSFPKIENEHLLKEKGQHETPQSISNIKELGPQEMFDLVFNGRPEEVWEKVKNKEKVEFKNNFVVVDVRNDGEYEDHHIPESLHVPFHDIDAYLQKNKKNLTKSEAVIFVCRRGNISRLAAYKAEQLGIKSISLKGGDAEWSRLNLPRVRADKCIVRFDL